jgi:uncharacterized membrane protein
MNITVIAYFAVAVVLLALDMIWLGTTFEPLYRPAVGEMMSRHVALPAAIAFYLLYPAGIVFFAVFPALRGQSWSTALWNGALFGFFCYATYDLTNLATLRIWSLKISLIDMGWGAFLTATAASASYFVTTFAKAKLR